MDLKILSNNILDVNEIQFMKAHFDYGQGKMYLFLRNMMSYSINIDKKSFMPLLIQKVNLSDLEYLKVGEQKKYKF